MASEKYTVTFIPDSIQEGGTALAEIQNNNGTADTVSIDLVRAGDGSQTVQRRLGEHSFDTTVKTITVEIPTAGLIQGPYQLVIHEFKDGKKADPVEISGKSLIVNSKYHVDSHSEVTLKRSATFPTRDQALWVAIRHHTHKLGFEAYADFLDHVFNPRLEKLLDAAENGFVTASTVPVEGNTARHIALPKDLRINFQGPYAYALLKLATHAFLTMQCGVAIPSEVDPELDLEQERSRMDTPYSDTGMLVSRLQAYMPADMGGKPVLPYLERIVKALGHVNRGTPVEGTPFGHEAILQYRLTHPSLQELIWSYWMEEGMLSQTTKAIALRFQNQRSSLHDPLGELEIDPLRPLNNLLWGYIQDEHNQLTLNRRALEYAHQYGLNLVGRAVHNLAPADNRSKFIETFHNLLYLAAQFYKDDADTTVVADAFPMLNALKDVHLLLAEGAHNQFGDLAWTSRAEMLIQQWMLARPEMREFLRGRHMVPYQERWMGAVDAMKKLQGWSDTSVSHFAQLAVDGERLLLSIRYGDWSDMNNFEEQAKNWLRYWKSEIQRYLHAYQAVTGVDLGAPVADTREATRRFLPPPVLLQQRLSSQPSSRSLSAPSRRPRPQLLRRLARAQEGALLPIGGALRALEFEDGE